MARFMNLPEQAFDKLGKELKENDIVAFVYQGLGTDLKIGRIIQLKVCTRRGVKDLWAFCQIIGVNDNEFEATQWCLPRKMLKLNEDMLSDVTLVKLSSDSGKKENINMLSKETVNKIKQAFKDRGYKVNYRCKDFKQYIRVELQDGFRFLLAEEKRALMNEHNAVIVEVCERFGINVKKSSYLSDSSIRINN